MKSLPLILLAAFAAVAAPACANSNKSIRIEAGASAEGGNTVNGSIRVGEGAYVTGSLETVNGSIKIGNAVQAGAVESVNGRISIGDDAIIESSETVNGRNELGERVQVAGDVETVNGAIEAGPGSRIGGDVGAVNGSIVLTGVQVAGDVTNVNGDMELLDGTRVEGSVIVRKPKRMGWGLGRTDRSNIVIGADVVIEGQLELQREVRLYVHETARIGKITGVEPEMETYSGSEP